MSMARLTLALVAVLAGLGFIADDAPTGRRFEGKTIPDPPRQGQPWTAPATSLPKFLVRATRTLFDQGLADPRDCEYRAIEVVAGREGRTVATHGFVLPETPGEARSRRFAVAWSGLVYPLTRLGDPADLDADVRAVVATLQARGQDQERGPFGMVRGPWSRAFEPLEEFNAIDVASFQPLKACLLLRLGRADLAEAAWKAARPPREAPAGPGADLTTYGVSYLTLAQSWAFAHYDRATQAHARGDDGLALAGARALTKIQPLIEAKADEMGFERPNGVRVDGKPTPYLDFLGQLPDLLADQERRAVEPKRPPVPPPGGDKAARVAALVRDLDQVGLDSSSGFLSPQPFDSPVGKALLAEGDDAVEPLIEALRSDNRLTRSAQNPNNMGFGGGRRGPASLTRPITPVQSVAANLLAAILKVSFNAPISTTGGYDDPQNRSTRARAAIADQYQAYWNQYKSIPLVERWYRTLLDDKAPVGDWLQAVDNIATPEGRDNPSPRGETLRQGHEPTVSALIARRIAELLGQGGDNLRDPLDQVIKLADQLATWDPKAAVPSLREACRVLRRRLENSTNGYDHINQRLAAHFARYVLIRHQCGDADALPEYAAWLRVITPRLVQDNLLAALQPLWRLPAEPVLAEAAAWLFNDPQSPWLPWISMSRQNSGYREGDLIASPLILVPGFRALVRRELADKTPAGDVSVSEQRGIQIVLKSGVSTGIGSSKVDPLMPPPGQTVPFRLGDFYAWKLSGLEGSPPFELYWPEARRDQALAAMAAYLDRRGDRFVLPGPESGEGAYDGPARGNDHFAWVARLAFPKLDHPASREEVERGVAIFSNEGLGERRVVEMIKHPLRGNWVTLKDFPSIRMPVDPKEGPQTIYDRLGRFWQAEEVLIDGRWRRFYGFVGNHTVARVPAEEVQFNDFPYGIEVNVPDALEASFFGPAAEGGRGYNAGHVAGRPLLMTLRLTNRAGLDREAPVEFARSAEGRVSALRQGFDLKLERAPEGTTWAKASPWSYPQKPDAGLKWEAVPPRSDARFAPDAAPGSTRTLRPAESFDPLVIDLNHVFDVTRPGIYRVLPGFAAELGIANQSNRPAYFAIGEIPPDPPVRFNNGGDSFE